MAKNGTDATTMCVTIARATTGKRKVMVATGAYHGAATGSAPVKSGVVSEDRAHLVHYTFNDEESVRPRSGSAATISPPSWCRRSSTTPATIRRWSIRPGRGCCVRCATTPAPR